MREIRSRIRSVQSTQQITKAMKMVSVAKLRRVQSSGAGAGIYAEKSREILGHLLSGGKTFGNRFLTPHPAVRAVCCVLFVGNRGLCGTYNQEVLRLARELLAAQECSAQLVVVGRWGGDVIRQAGWPVLRWFTAGGDVPEPEEAQELAEYLEGLYLDGTVDEVHLVYQQYRSVLQQAPTSLQLLPIAPAADSTTWEDYIFEPSEESVIDSLVRAALIGQIYSVLREVRVGEQAARMTAMSAATDATAELIDRLSVELNRARQAAITTELTEIVGGAGALRGGEKE